MMCIRSSQFCVQRGRVRSPGFTLFELVIAMVLVAGVSAALYANMQIAFKAEAASNRIIEPSRTAEVAMEFVRQDFQNVLPLPSSTDTTTTKLVGTFQGTSGTDDRGDADDVVYYTTANAVDGPDANGDVKKVELLVMTPDGTTDHALVRRVTRNLLSSIDPVPKDEILLRNVDGLNIRYYDGSDWQETWDSTQLGDILPAAIEVTISLKRPQGKGEQDRTFKFVRTFAIPCASTSTDQSISF